MGSSSPKQRQQTNDPETSDILLKFPYIKIDPTKKLEKEKSIEKKKNSNGPQSPKTLEQPLTKFEKLLIEAIIKKYDIMIIDRKQVIDIEEKKYDLLAQNKRFLKEIKKALLSSKEFLGINSSFLNSKENERNFQFQKFVFCIQKLIKNFIRDYSKKNNTIFAFIKINNVKSATNLEPDSETKANHDNEFIENENQKIINNILKNVNFTTKEGSILKKIFYRIHPFSMKSYFDVIIAVDNYIEEKQSCTILNFK